MQRGGDHEVPSQVKQSRDEASSGDAAAAFKRFSETAVLALLVPEISRARLHSDQKCPIYFPILQQSLCRDRRRL